MSARDTTLLFTDIEGSTRLLGLLGESTYGDVLALHHQLIRQAIAQHGGEEVGTEGDSFFATFRCAADGVIAAAEAQRGLTSASWPVATKVRVRMGLHTGPVALAGGNLVGMSIHAAARIKSAAHGGQIVVSGETVRDAGNLGDVSFTSLGQHRLRDIAGRTELFQVDAPDLAHEFPPPASEPSDFALVPAEHTPLVGRRSERSALKALLEEHRVVTITGPPGVGKTRLAVAVVAGRGDAAFVDLTALDEVSLVAPRVAGALGVTASGDEGVLDALARQVGDSRAVVVVDNCEHLADEVAAVVARISSQCSGVRVLATSREALGIAGEVVWSLGPLDEAAELFVARVQASNRSVDLSSDDPLVVAICDRLDQLPLAVELAAAQVGRMTLADLFARLDDQFGLLRGARRDVPVHHHTLQAAIDWSARLLDAEEHAALRHLSVMRGPFDLAAAEAVCGEATGAILALRDRSLLAFEGDAHEGRFRMLETIRSYAARALVKAGEVATAEEAHARAFQMRARERVRAAGASEAALVAIDQDIDNYEAALRWLSRHDPAGALALAVDLEGLFVARLPAEVGVRILEVIVEKARDAAPDQRAVALVILADIYRNAGRVDDARRSAEAGVALETAASTRRFSGPVMLGQILAMQGELDEAARLFQESLVTSRERGDVTGIATSLREIANVAIERNKPQDAVAPLDELRGLVATQQEIRWMMGVLASDRARVALSQGRIADARAAYESGLARAQQLGVPRAIAGCSLGLSAVARLEGEPDQARALLQEAARIHRVHGDLGGLARAFVQGALLHSASGHHESATQLLAGADAARARLHIVTPGSEEADIARARSAALDALGADPVERLTQIATSTPWDDLTAIL